MLITTKLMVHIRLTAVIVLNLLAMIKRARLQLVLRFCLSWRLNYVKNYCWKDYGEGCQHDDDSHTKYELLKV